MDHEVDSKLDPDTTNILRCTMRWIQSWIQIQPTFYDVPWGIFKVYPDTTNILRCTMRWILYEIQEYCVKSLHYDIV